MNCFQIIKSVLDEAYNEIPGTEAVIDREINDALEYLRNEYSRLLTENAITYSDPITRFAYIYVYVTSHANLVWTLIENNNNLGKIFNNQQVKVACIGGGPGSDFLGIIKYLIKNKKSPKISFQLCDREKTWAESWSDVDGKVDPGLRISTSYLPLDVTNPQDWTNYTKYFQSDLFTMIYFMSEVYAEREEADEYFSNLFSQAKSESLFLFVDNNKAEFYDWFDKLAENHNIKIIDKDETIMNVPFDEQKSDLGIYLEKFDYPKLRANVAYRIAKKEDNIF